MVLLGAITVIVILCLILHRMQNSETKPKSNTASSPSSEPRDFLKQAEGMLNPPKPFSMLVEENRPLVLSSLANFLTVGGTYERKYAAFSLGQIGDASAIAELEKCLIRESVQGVREAIGASIAALKIVPSNNGYTDLDRRMVIEDVYNGRSPRMS